MKIKTVKLIALRNLYYEGDRFQGEQFDAQPEHVEILIRMGAAKAAQESKDGQYSRRDLRAEA